MYCLYFMFTNYSCKYHEILGCDHDMYVMKYVGMLRIYIPEVSMRSAKNRYISIKYSILSANNTYIYEVWKVLAPAKCHIVFKCFSYDVFMGYIHLKQLISKVHILGTFLDITTYVDVLLEVNVKILHV